MLDWRQYKVPSGALYYKAQEGPYVWRVDVEPRSDLPTVVGLLSLDGEDFAAFIAARIHGKDPPTLASALRFVADSLSRDPVRLDRVIKLHKPKSRGGETK